MPSAATDRLTHAQIRSVCPGKTDKERECPLCRGKLSLYGEDKFLCCNPRPCDKKAVAAAIYNCRDEKKLRPSQKPGWEGLTLVEYCAEKRLPTWWVATHYTANCWQSATPMERLYKGKPVVEFAYMDVNRKVHFKRFRESMESRPVAEAGSTMSIPYGLWLYTNKPDADGVYPRAVVICEGESDQMTLTYHRIPALGVPGTTCWREEWAKLPVLKYAEKIFVIQERPKNGKPDTAGRTFVRNVTNSFPAGKVVPLKLDFDDPSDLHIEVEVRNDFSSEESTKQYFMDHFVASIRSVMVESRQVKSVMASQVEMAVTRWLWCDHIPVGDITVFAGMPQKGKSTAAIDVVARLTTGSDFPGSARQVDACEVAILASEDNPKTTTVPRLKAAQADADKVHLIQGTSDGNQEWEIALDEDLERLKEYLRNHPRIRLIVIDPVTSYIGNVDPNKPKEVRPFLNKLKKFSEEMGVSLLLIMHLSKNPDVSALHRVGGAATWIEVPRSVWFFDEKRQESDSAFSTQYVMVNGKLNIVADERKKSLEYTFESVDVEIQGFQQSMGRIKWGAESTVTLEQQYGRGKGKSGPDPVKTEAAMEWLKLYLAEGPRKSVDVFADGDVAGHKRDTLYEAKSRLGVTAKKNVGGFEWALPELP
jgi:hypothetical protein